MGKKRSFWEIGWIKVSDFLIRMFLESRVSWDSMITLSESWIRFFSMNKVFFSGVRILIESLSFSWLVVRSLVYSFSEIEVGVPCLEKISSREMNWLELMLS